MNDEDCLKLTINETISNALDRLSYLSTEDRGVLLMEHLEDIAT